MMIADGIEYLTKEEAAARCKAFAATNPGSTFHNYAHTKAVRRPATAEEQVNGRLTVTVYEWNKLYNDSAAVKAHPELKGLWRQATLKGGN